MTLTEMNAALYRSFHGPIRVERVAVPAISLQDGVLIQVQVTGICRSDWHGWKGHDGDIKTHGLPFCPGHEFSGIVVQSTSPKFKRGNRVVVPFILSCGSCPSCCIGKSTICEDQRQPGFTQWGSFAEYVSIPRASRNVKLIPDNVTFLQAAALGCRFTTAYRAVVHQGRLKRDHSTAIFGCGGLGLSCIVFAALVGAYPIVAIDVSDAALMKARELGATHTVLSTSNEDTREQVWTITDRQGAHVTFDAAGFSATCENAVYCTRRGGRMVQVGLPIGGISPQVPMGLVVSRELELIGSHGFTSDDLTTLMNMIAAGRLDPLQLVERSVPLDEGAQILMDMDCQSPLGVTMITSFSATKSTNHLSASKL